MQYRGILRYFFVFLVWSYIIFYCANVSFGKLILRFLSTRRLLSKSFFTHATSTLFHEFVLRRRIICWCMCPETWKQVQFIYLHQTGIATTSGKRRLLSVWQIANHLSVKIWLLVVCKKSYLYILNNKENRFRMFIYPYLESESTICICIKNLCLSKFTNVVIYLSNIKQPTVVQQLLFWIIIFITKKYIYIFNCKNKYVT